MLLAIWANARIARDRAKAARAMKFSLLAGRLWLSRGARGENPRVIFFERKFTRTLMFRQGSVTAKEDLDFVGSVA